MTAQNWRNIITTCNRNLEKTQHTMKTHLNYNIQWKYTNVTTYNGSSIILQQTMENNNITTYNGKTEKYYH